MPSGNVGLRSAEADHPRLVGVRQRLQQHAVDHGEDGHVGADAERQRHDGHQRESGLFRQRTGGETHLVNAGHPDLPRAPDKALSERNGAGRLPVHWCHLGGYGQSVRGVDRREPPVADPGLAARYFQFGRYLLIASSQAGSLPANLQGLWNASLSPPWGSKYRST